MCCLLLPTRAQAPEEVRIRSGAWFPPSLVISTDANLVELVATVRDRHGHLTGGLQAADFEVLDNNQPREITFFSEQRAQPAGPAPAAGAKHPAAATLQAPPPEPRSIALFFDDAHASVAGVRMSAQAAERLVANNLPPGDKVGIFTPSGTVSLDFTSDRKLLLAALARLRPHPPEGVHSTTMCPTLGPSEAYIIVRHLDPAIEDAAVDEAVGCNCPQQPPDPACIFDQRGVVQSAAQSVWQQYEYQSTNALDALLIVVRHLAAAPGKRVLVQFSPGFPTGGMEERTSALTDAALRANIRISAVNSEGLVTGRTEMRKLFLFAEFMAAASKSTGGQYLHDMNDWAGTLPAVVAAPEVSYVLGFSPPGDPDGKYHLLKTRIRGNLGYRVETRPGYYAAAATSKSETAQQHIDRVAMSGADIKDFPVILQVQADPAGGQAKLHVTIAVETGGLRFPEKKGRRVQELTFLTVLEDAAGNFVAGKQSVMDLELTPASLAGMQEKGIRAATSFSVNRRGSYRVREVVREVVQDHIWASAAPIEIR
jgi:VWFA-related protein